MECNNCPSFSVGKLKVINRYNYNRNYYYILLVKCSKMNSILRIIRNQQGLEDVEIPDVKPPWNCPELQKLRKQDKVPHFEMSIL